jgi:hypothetical protein
MGETPCVTSCPFCGDAANKGARLAKVVAKVWGLPAGRPSRATTTLTAFSGGPLPGRVWIAEEDVDVTIDGDLLPVPHFLASRSQVNDARSTAGRVFADPNIAALAGRSR